MLNTASFGRARPEEGQVRQGPARGRRCRLPRDRGRPRQRTKRGARRAPARQPRSKDRCKNMFALGILYWLFHRDMAPTMKRSTTKFGEEAGDRRGQPEGAEGRLRLRRDDRALPDRLPRAAAPMRPGTYRNIMGNQALCLGLVAGGKRAGLPLFLGSYPITPASDILHQLSDLQAPRRRHLPGRGRDRRGRRRDRRVLRRAARRHLDQRSGHRAQGRGDRARGDDRAAARRPQRAARRPEHRHADEDRAGRPAAGDVRPQRRVAGADRRRVDAGRCFEVARSVRIALTYMVPVILLSDGYIANGSEPWLLPDPASCRRSRKFAHRAERPARSSMPYKRDPKTLAPAVGEARHAGTRAPHRRHREGGRTGNISYDPRTTSTWSNARAEGGGIADDMPPMPVDRPAHRRRAGARLGQHARRDHRGRHAPAEGRGHKVSCATCAT
jgi:2-oxoglutarate ferredoxin oxidoreductase subunit alpha